MVDDSTRDLARRLLRIRGLRFRQSMLEPDEHPPIPDLCDPAVGGILLQHAVYQCGVVGVTWERGVWTVAGRYLGDTAQGAHLGVAVASLILREGRR